MTSIHHSNSAGNTGEGHKRFRKSLRLRIASLWGLKSANDDRSVDNTILPTRPPSNGNNGAYIQKNVATMSNPCGLTMLYTPENPLLDFVFVHGLRGGSTKTWCVDGDPKTFWPKEWLSKEDDFKNVRISSFGYLSDWISLEKSNVNLQDLGRNLLAALLFPRGIGREARTPIVLVGHSMGGLIIKQAYLLAIQNRESQQHQYMAQRMKCMVFLATPHRGSTAAIIASTLLRCAQADKQYVEDLERNSGALSTINESFLHVADSARLSSALSADADTLELHTIYEVEALGPRPLAQVIVPEASAVLGLPGEISSFLQANHRTICKFKTQDEDNYTILKTRLGAIAQSMIKKHVIVDKKRKALQMQEIGTLLHRAEDFQREVHKHLASKTPRSCEWIETRAQFQEWRDCAATPEIRSAVDNTWSPSSTTFQNNLKVYWLTAKAGAGKSVCSAHVITHLRSRNLDCAYYFFKAGGKSQLELCDMLRSIAYQMADQCSQIRMSLSEAQNSGLTLDGDHPNEISIKLYSGLIFKCKTSPRMQYWVLDAMDECNVASMKEFVKFLASVPSGFGLRVFVTSRPGVEPKRLFENHGAVDKLIVEPITSADTQGDMLLYLKSHKVGASMDYRESRHKLRDKLLMKSNGCFLWLNLVRQELDEVETTKSRAQVLDEIPTEMSDWYERCFKTLSHTHLRRRHDLLLSQALFMWVICAIRPLQLEELLLAIEGEMIACGYTKEERTVDTLRSIFPKFSGFLLDVDHSNHVQLCHSTVRDFLMDPKRESSYAIESSVGHQKLLIRCLEYIGLQLKRSKARSVENSRIPPNHKRATFTTYASIAFSEHLAASSSKSLIILESLFKFLTENILSWVEHVVMQQSSLDCLIRTAKNLRNYVERLKKHVALLGAHFKTVEQWSVDLVRLVAKFGHNLKRYPGTIHTIIPSLAPRTSLLHQQRYNESDGLEMVGPAGQSWNDCAAVIHGGDVRVTVLTCGQQFFAVGHKDGRIVLYDHATYEEKRTIQDLSTPDAYRKPSNASDMKSNPIKLIATNDNGTLLASACLKHVYIWSLEGELVRSFTINEPCMLLAFSIDGEAVIVVTRSSCILRLNIHGANYAFDSLIRETRRPSGSGTNQAALQIPRQAPITAAISPDQSIVALLYRGRPIYLCDPEDNSVIGLCGRDVDSKSPNISVQTALFNPNHDLNLFAVSYQDGELALYNSLTRKELSCVSGDAYTLASTPDGQTLGSGDTRGTISLWDFETLTLLYQIRGGLDEIRLLSFTSDSSRLVDLRDSKINIWEPAVLVRKSALEDASMSDALPLEASVVGDNEEIITLTTICHDRTGDFIFAGRSDGSVAAYTTSSGTIQNVMFTHSGDLFVSTIASRNDIIATADAGGRILVHKLQVSSDVQTITPTLILDIRQSEPVQSLIVSEDGSRLLVATPSQSATWNLETGVRSAQHLCSSTEPIHNSAWTAGIASFSTIVTFTNRPALVAYDGVTLQIKKSAQQLLEFPGAEAEVPAATADDIVCEAWGRYLIVYRSNLATLKTRSDMVVYDKNADSAAEGPLRPILKVPATTFHTFIGVYLHSLVFLDPELWVCSFNLDHAGRSGSIDRIKHHFFIPSDLLSGSSRLRPILSPCGYVVFAKDDKLAVIKGLQGLERNA